MPVQVEGTLDLSGILADGKVKEDGDLTISINPFYYDISGSKGYYIGAVGQLVTDNQTNYVYLDGYGVLTINTTGYTTDLHLRLARVVASGGFITRIISERALFSTALSATLGSFFANPMTTQGDIIVGGTSGTANRLGGTDGYYLKSHGTTSSPTWVRTLDVSGVVISDIIDDTLDSSAVFEAKSTDKGILLPSLTDAQMNAIASPANGLLIYNTDVKRFYWFDGSIWRRLNTNIDKVITVSPYGSSDFTSIQAALDSITSAADNDRYIIDIAPAIYTENIYPKGYVTIKGTGWDTVLDGYVVFEHALGDANIKDLRISSLNYPAITINTDDEADLIGCFVFSEYNNSAPPATTRSAVKVLKGIFYAYQETEISLTTTENLSTDPNLIYTIYNVSGTSLSFNESYGTFHNIDITNSYNEINILTNTGDSAGTYGWLKNCYTTINFNNTVHTNNVKFINSVGGSGYFISDLGRVDLECTTSINPNIYVAVCDNSTSNLGHCRYNRSLINKINIPDSNIYLGYSTTTNDEVEITETIFITSTDVLPTRYTIPGILGSFSYAVSNQFGSRSFTGTLNGIRFYPSSATDHTTPTPTDGDMYYNTAINCAMRYDGSRSKWLSVETGTYIAGRNGNTAAGSFYRGMDGLTFGTNIGYSIPKGTLVYLSLSKTDSNNTTLEVVVDTTQIATLVCNGAGNFINTTMNANFNAGLLKFRNLSSGATTSNVQISAVIKRRV